MRSLIIDNYDSMTFNLFQLLSEVNGEEPLVLKNDEHDWAYIKTLDFDNIVVSPGPGSAENPGDFGVSRDAILKSDRPVLGVCLGMQGIAHLYGARIVRAPEPMHGRISLVRHTGEGLFEALPDPLTVVRYHSLTVARPLPAALEPEAWTDDGLIMALRLRGRPVWGVQFHPESICSERGHALLENFRRLTQRASRCGHASRRRPGGRRHAVPGFAAPAATGRACERRLHVRRKPLEWDAESLFMGLFSDSPHAFWLDSSRVEKGLSRFSFMGDAAHPEAEVIAYDVRAHTVRVHRGDTVMLRGERVFDLLRERLAATRTVCEEEPPFDFWDGYVGYFGYELQHDLGTGPRHASRAPDAAFIRPVAFLAIDHERGELWLACSAANGDERRARDWLDGMERRLEHLPAAPPLSTPQSGAPLVCRLRHDAAAYHALIERCREALWAGESYEICLTNEITAPLRAAPLAVYRHLRRLNPAPYAAYLKLPGATVMCSSPERFLKIDRMGWMESKPIKGTCPRDPDPDHDRRLALGLQTSEKERAENLMIVDLLRNDLGLVAEIGSVHVPKLMAVESYQTVHQLVSTVRGRLHPELSPVDAVRATFPGGSMTGSPKRRTLDIIDALEGGPRGVYSGAIGFLSHNGCVDLNIVIRSIVADEQCMSIGCGGAITVLSDPAQEFAEILLKARAPLEALALAATGCKDGWRLHGSETLAQNAQGGLD